MTRNDKNGKEITKHICYILQFIDGARFMTSSLSNLVNNLFERIHRNRRKFLPDDEKFETFGIKCKCCDCLLKYKHFKDDLIEYKCLICNQNCQRKFDEKLKKRFFHAFKFSNHDYNNFILLLQEDV